MNKSFLLYTILFAVLILLQVLIFNNLILFNLAVCFIFIYLILRLPIFLSVNVLLTVSFFLGLIVDIFSDTLGVNTFSCLILAAVRQPVFYAYVSKDDKTKEMTPSIREMGWGAYSKYALTMSAIFCLIAFGVEFFSFENFKLMLMMAGASTIFTFPVILGVDSMVDAGDEIHR